MSEKQITTNEAADEPIDASFTITKDSNGNILSWTRDGKTETLSADEQNAILLRKAQKLREANAELHSLHDEMAALRREVNGYKKPIADAQTKVDRLIAYNTEQFVEWEKHENPPTLFDDADAWRELPVDQLDVPEKDIKRLAEHFITCGDVTDWLCKDYPEKYTGLNGGKTKERLRAAINKISGVDQESLPDGQSAQAEADTENETDTEDIETEVDE